MRRKLSGIAGAVVMAGAVAGLVGPAVGASASTPRCTAGTLQPQCGDYVNQSGNGWAVYKQRLQPGTPVIAFPAVRGGKQVSDPATDFYAFTPNMKARANRSFEWVPNGILSGLCLADLDNVNLVKPHGVVLRWCNGSRFHVRVGALDPRRLLGLEHPGHAPALAGRARLSFGGKPDRRP